jgi:glycerol-1-phosphate dehydrogenase [NAD(P)+]
MNRSTGTATIDGVPAGGWSGLINDIVADRWINPENGQTVTVPYESVVIDVDLDGREADLVQALALGDSFTVVADAATWDALGARVAKALAPLGPVKPLILNQPHADMATVADLTHKLADAVAVIAVGSGTINDLCKYVTGLDGRRYAVFGTAASMNGYTSTTASITLESGLKVSIPSHAPSGVFIDLAVSAAAPRHLSAAGFGDCLVRSVAQVDWWMSHRLLGSAYSNVPFLIQQADEKELNARAHLIPAGNIGANGYLHRVLTLCGLGVSYTGMSNHGSMGEHQISHYIDCFAGGRHPGTLHGQQVGVGVLTMARLQAQMLAGTTPPLLRPTVLDPADMARRMGQAVASECLADIAPKTFDANATDALNETLQQIWPDLRDELARFIIPLPEMERLLRASGGPATAGELGVPGDFYREAVIHCREMRNRYSFLDLAADSGMLADFAAGEH